jgi:hypothetical protein
MRQVHKRYLRELLSAMAAYVLVLFGSIWLLRNPGSGLDWPAKSALALLPMLPIAFAARAIVRVIRDSDELERQIDLEAAGIAGLVVGLAYLSLGLLETARVLDLDAGALAIWVFPALCLVFGLARCWSSWRYRG